MPFRKIVMKLHKLQQEINYVPSETKVRKTKRVEGTYNR